MAALHIAYRYGDTRLFARLVCLLGGGDSAHVEVAEPLGGGLWRCVSSSWLDGGPRVKVMPLPAEKWRIYKTDIDGERAGDWLKAHYHQGYGWVKLLRFVFPWFRPSWGGPICTECWAAVLGVGLADSWHLRTSEAVTAWRYERTQ